MITVSVDLFSGRENPYWRVPKKEEGRIVALLKNVSHCEVAKKRLGYRGVIVELITPDGRKYHRICGNRKVELKLVKTGKPFLARELYEMILAKLERDLVVDKGIVLAIILFSFPYVVLVASLFLAEFGIPGQLTLRGVGFYLYLVAAILASAIIFVWSLAIVAGISEKLKEM